MRSSAKYLMMKLNLHFRYGSLPSHMCLGGEPITYKNENA